MYRIVDWAKHFENNRTKELKKLQWVPMPNKHDGDGYTELLLHPEGPSHFGAWCAIVEVASKCDPRGTLLRDGARPHTAASLARMSMFPVEVMQAALDRLVSPVGWIEVITDPIPQQTLTEIPQAPAVKSQIGATAPQESALNGMEAKGSEGNGTSRSANGKANGSSNSLGESPSADHPLRRSRRDFFIEKRERLANLADLDWSHVCAMAEAAAKLIEPLSVEDRRMWLRYAVLAATAFSEDWLIGAADAVVKAKHTKRTKQAHFVGVLKARAADSGCASDTFLGMLGSIEIPDDVWKSSVLGGSK